MNEGSLVRCSESIWLFLVHKTVAKAAMHHMHNLKLIQYLINWLCSNSIQSPVWVGPHKYFPFTLDVTKWKETLNFLNLFFFFVVRFYIGYVILNLTRNFNGEIWFEFSKQTWNFCFIFFPQSFGHVLHHRFGSTNELNRSVFFFLLRFLREDIRQHNSWRKANSERKSKKTVSVRIFIEIKLFRQRTDI